MEKNELINDIRISIQDAHSIMKVNKIHQIIDYAPSAKRGLFSAPGMV